MKFVKKVGEFEPLLKVAQKRKLRWFGHVSRRPGTLAHDVMHGMVNGSRRRGRPRANWSGDVGKWTAQTVVECVRAAQDRKNWRKTLNTVPQRLLATGVT